MCDISRRKGKWCYRLCSETADPLTWYLERWGTLMWTVAAEIAAEPLAGDTPGMLGTAQEYAGRTRVVCIILDTLRNWHPFKTAQPRGKRGRACGNPQ